MAGNTANTANLMAEIVPPRQRSRAVLGVFLIAPIGLCLLSLLAYFIPNWKVLTLSSALLTSIVGLAFFIVPESIHWLLVNGKEDEAVSLLTRISGWNRRPLPANFEILFEKMKFIGAHKTQNNKPLFSWYYLKITIIQCSFWSVTAIVYYGLVIASDDLSNSMYINFALTSLAELPAIFIAVYTLEKFGRKKTLLPALLFSSISCVGIALMPTEASWHPFRVTMGVFGRFCICIIYDSMFLWAAELYPTEMRSRGCGILNLVSKIGGTCMPWLFKTLGQVNGMLPFIVIGGFGVLATLLMTILPETKGKSLPSIITDEQERLCKDTEVIAV